MNRVFPPGPPVIERGGFAKDKRTGTVVKVAEKGGRDWMVKPAYKSDGYWTAPDNLVWATDPHPANAKWLIKFLLAMLAGAWIAYSGFNDMTGHGFSGAEAFAYTVPGGVVALWLVNVLTGNHRS